MQPLALGELLPMFPDVFWECWASQLPQLASLPPQLTLLPTEQCQSCS